MEKEASVLFGLDDSDFSRQGLLAAGEVLKSIEKSSLTMFHGAMDFDLFSRLMDQDPATAEKQREQWYAGAKKVLDDAREALVADGFDAKRLSAEFERKCSDPAVSITDLARRKGIETVAVARWGKKTVSRQVIGSTTYRLALMADNLTLWVIDPRICSHNVLIALVGASVSKRVVDYAVRHFARLKGSRFTLMHVIPAVPQWMVPDDGAQSEGVDEHEKIARMVKEYGDTVKSIAEEARNQLVGAGVPEQNISCKIVPQKIGIARDILFEMEEGNHGILVIGRKGFKAIEQFGLGSKANKLLLSSRAFMVALVP